MLECRLPFALVACNAVLNYSTRLWKDDATDRVVLEVGVTVHKSIRDLPDLKIAEYNGG